LEEQVWAITEGRSLGESQLLPSVQQWQDFKVTGVLPRAGGTLDQDPEFMRDLRLILGYEQKFKEVGANKQAAREEINRQLGRK
jgi:hypothetical protein